MRVISDQDFSITSLIRQYAVSSASNAFAALTPMPIHALLFYHLYHILYLLLCYRQPFISLHSLFHLQKIRESDLQQQFLKEYCVILHSRFLKIIYKLGNKINTPLK